MDSPREVVELDLEEDWWLWRGFLPYNRAKEEFMESPEFEKIPVWGISEQSRRDPMDQAEYSEERAFPLLKPSIDVLGVPRRSRRQRGWYQVRSPRTSTSTVSNPLPPMRTAADLPLDLVSMIAEAARWLLVDRHQLASCASVCQSWTKVLRPRLFATLSINSRAHMNYFLKIQRSPLGESLQRSATTLCLTQQLDEIPFTHLAHLVRMKVNKLSELRIVGPLPSNQGRSLRSIHGCIPRTLPSSSIRHFNRLELRDIHFRSVADFVRLVRELHFLIFLTGARLTWGGGREEVLSTPARRRASRGCLQKVQLTDCTSHHRWLALLAVCTPEICSVVGGLVQLVEDQWSEASTLSMNRSPGPELHFRE